MSDSGPRRSLLARLLNWTPSPATPNGHAPEAKSWDQSGVRIDPAFDFMSPDGMRTVIELVGRGSSEAERVSAETAYTAAAYAFVAMRWRAAQLSQPPLMVVKEDQATGDEEWLPRHPMAPLLEEPNPDYEMGELLFRTSIAVDQGGHALWTKDADGLGRPGRLQLFSERQFKVKSTTDRIRGLFRVETSRGPKELPPEQVVYFHEVDPNDWLHGLPRLEVFLGWLNLAQTARATVRDLLRNALWPSLVVAPDKEWNPSPEDFKIWQQEVQKYGMPGERGKAITLLGGGTASVVQTRMRDLVPAEVLDRVESVCAAVFGVPAIVLQFMVGMQNSPWSQFETARKMAIQDTVEPLWRETEKRLTRQLLRPTDPDPTHFIRFDTSQVRALQTDKAAMALVATQLARIASLNERRALVDLEPITDDPAADEIPELQPPPPMVGGLFGNPADPTDDPPPADAGKRLRAQLEAKRDIWAALRANEVERSVFTWKLRAHQQLEADRDAIVALAREHLDAEKEAVPSSDSRRRFRSAVHSYLEGLSKRQWTATVGPLIAKDAARSTRAIAADLGVSFNLVRPALDAYATREAAWLVKGLTETTRDTVAEVLRAGIADGVGASGIAERLKASSGFSQDRSLLIARTEATRVTQGGPTEALQDRAAATGTRYTKTWRGVMDEREREEHVAMEGETVGIDEEFSNGLQFPCEPNCRCVLTYQEVPSE